MFHGKKRLNTLKEHENENKNQNKTYKSQKKVQSKHSHSRKKRLEDRIKKSTFSCGNYESDFVGTKRLTKCVGFLAKGKISDSISRLEKTMPDGVKARAELDLIKVIHYSKELNTKHLNTSMELMNQNGISSQNEISLSSSDSSCSPYTVDKNKFAYSAKAQNSKFSSVSNSENVGDHKSELSTCRNIILNRLHFAVAEFNKQLFPGVSNQTVIKKEFLILKNEYNSSQQTFSSSNNCESSQEIFYCKNTEVLVEENFKLNPVLTQEASASKNLEDMFPSSQEDDSSDSSVQILEEPKIQNELVPSSCMQPKESTYSSGRVNWPFALKPCSSDSSSDSPVWKPVISPVKFVPNFPPTPKLYYRQKMF